MNKFKIGDKVYFPKESNKVFTIEDTECTVSYPLRFGAITFTRDGRRHTRDITPSLFHATPENKAKLEALYGVEFETPPVKPTSREIIKAMLARGDKSVCCWVSDSSEDPTSSYSWAFIISAFDDVFIDECGTAWEFATPFNPRTGETITELPE